LPEPLEVINLPSDRLAPLSGRYQLNSDEAFTLEARGNRLFGKPPTGEEYELFAIAQDLFVRKERETRYQIETSGGKVSGILLLENGQRIAAKRMRPGVKLPSDDVYAGRIEEAIKAYRALYALKADDPGVAEARLNRLGYDFLGHKEYAKAIAVLTLNTELYAAASNTYDSLAEACTSQAAIASGRSRPTGPCSRCCLRMTKPTRPQKSNYAATPRRRSVSCRAANPKFCGQSLITTWL
jgi:hypothetical protein